MRITDLFPAELLHKQIEAGDVVEVKHPLCPDLRLLGVTNFARRLGHWNSVTREIGSGVLVGPDQEIVARGFRKVFDIGTEQLPETWTSNLPLRKRPEISHLLDGVCGMAFNFKHKNTMIRGVATRNNFLSPLAQWATCTLGMKYRKARWPENCTPVFELLHPMAQRVLTYREPEIVLLALVHRDTGEHATYGDAAGWAEFNGFSIVELQHNYTIGRCVTELEPQSGRGYMAKWHLGQDVPPLMVRIQSSVYTAERELFTYLNSHRIWELAKLNTDIDAFIQGFKPKSKYLQTWIRNRYQYYQKAFDSRKSLVKSIYDSGPNPSQKSDHQELMKYFAKRQEYVPALMAMLNGESIDEYVWETLRPLNQETAEAPE
jgi:hypothetical protein